MSFFVRRKYLIRGAAIIATGALFMPSLRMMARQRERTRHTHRRIVHRRHRHHRRYHHYRHHYTHLHLAPKRVRQIQEALIKAGCLHGKPDGIWGPATRDAMREYQKRNGFTPTGLPEAKPLMKLGLGPHPLPPGLNPPKDDGQSEAEASAAPSTTPSKSPSTSNQ